MDLDAFFMEEGIDEYTIVRIEDLQDADRSGLLHLIPLVLYLLVADFCGNCGWCVRSCPGGAIGSDGINVFRCRNISPWIPAPLLPATTWLLVHQSLQRIAAPFAPLVARHATMRCSLCVTVCPCFHNGEDAKNREGCDPSQSMIGSNRKWVYE